MSPTTTQTSPKGAKHPAYATCDHHEVQNSPIVIIPKHRTTNKLVRERYTHKHTPPRNENAANTRTRLPTTDYKLTISRRRGRLLSHALERNRRTTHGAYVSQSTSKTPTNRARPGANETCERHRSPISPIADISENSFKTSKHIPTPFLQK